MDADKMPSISLRDLAYVIFKRKTRMLIFFGVIVCSVAVATFMSEPTYQATAQILVQAGRENVSGPDLSTDRNSSIIRITWAEQISAEIEILRSQFLGEKVVEVLGPTVIYEELQTSGPGLLAGLFRDTEASEPPPDHASQVVAAAARLQKSLTVEKPKDSTVINISFIHSNPDMAARVVNTLVSLYSEHRLRVHKNPRLYDFFRDQADILRTKVKASEARLEAFKRQHDLTSLEEEQKVLLTQVALYKTRLLEVGLKEQELRTKYTDENRLVESIRNDTQMVREGLAELEGRRSRLSQIETELSRLRDEVEVDRENYRLYLTKFEEARISKAMDTEQIANVSLIESARPPLKPVSPKILLNMLLAISVGGFGGLGLALLSEYMDDSLDRAEDVENHLHLPVLASIPDLGMDRRK